MERHAPPRLFAAASDVPSYTDVPFYNEQLHAHNVFEIDVDESIIDEAESLFEDRDGGGAGSSPFGSVGAMREPYADIATAAGGFTYTGDATPVTFRVAATAATPASIPRTAIAPRWIRGRGSPNLLPRELP